MAGMEGITLALDRSRFDHTLRQLLRGVDDFGPVADVIAELLTNSVRQNFDEGGRPEPWPVSKRADGDAAYGRKSGQTLVDTSRLLNSITGVGNRHGARVGTNVEYAAAHNFGVDKVITQQVAEHTRRITRAFGKEIPLREVRVKSHKRTMHMKLPQREFMMVQEEDWEDIEDVISIRLEQLLKGAGK